jgi:ferric-dicitrate binding protein FerR (iron transport regulator)
MKNLIAKYINSVCSPEEFEKFIDLILRKENDDLFPVILKPVWDQYMQQESTLPSSNDLLRKINVTIEEMEKRRIRRKLTLNTWGLRIAALLLIGLVLTNLFLLRRASFKESFITEQTVSIPFGARTSFSLPDGSKVWLNSGSTLSYGNNFGKIRSVSLEGEAYFEVMKSKIPFIVSTPLGDIQVMGTAFNVKAFQHENEFITTLVEGVVSVTENRENKTVVLQPGQQSSLLNGRWEILNVDPYLYTSWREGKIIFRREYLPEVVKSLEYWYNVKIELDDDPRLRKIHYTGTIEMESFSEILELLKITAPITYTYDDKQRIIKIKYRR